jgi:hypothetical protein
MRKRLLWPGVLILLVAAVAAVNIVMIVVASRQPHSEHETPRPPAERSMP